MKSMLKRNELFWASLGGGISLLLFLYLCSLDLSLRVRGDAYEYLSLALGFRSWGEALSYVGNRTVGFPLFLFILRKIAQFFSPQITLPEFVNFVSFVLLIVHWSSSFLFYISARKIVFPHQIRIHPAALFLILIHPGLIGYSSTTVTDTFGTDLILLAISLVLQNRLYLLAGVILGYASLVRPFYCIGIGVGILASFLLSQKFDLKNLKTTAWLGLGVLIPCLPAVAVCTYRFSQACVQNPEFVSKSMSYSLQVGLLEVRHYWSGFSQNPDFSVSIQDSLLQELWRPEVGYLGNIYLLPLLILKKTLALFDHYHLQPYAVDLTPLFFRAYSRVFGAICFAGFAGTIAFLIFQLKQWISIFSVPICIFLSHIFMHLEARYGFPAVPISLFGAVLVLQLAFRQPRPKKALYLTFLSVSMLVFFIQTSLWDLSDPVLSKIENTKSK
jgi:hypothetical protein